MVARGDHDAGHGSAHDGERFAVERFTWASPDRLDVAGTFVHLEHAPTAEPTLVVRSGGALRQLPAVAGSVDGPPRAGEPWSATFTWEEPPVPFDAAQLTFGDELAVALPGPSAADGQEPHVVPVLRGPGDGGGDAGSVPARVRRIRLETDLLAAQEQTRELRVAAERSAAELTRVQAELEDERRRHAAEAERFHEGLAQVRALAERTAAAAQDEGERQAAELDAARSQAVELSAELEAARAQLDDQGAELQQTRERLAHREGLLAAVAAARTDAQRAVDRLTEIADASDGG